MIQIRMSVEDLGRTRFAYSPLAEIAESFYLLFARQRPLLHQGWLAAVRPRLHRVDLKLLRAVLPDRPFVADLFFLHAVDRATTVEQQLQTVAAMPVDVLRRDLEGVWHDEPLPPLLHDLVTDEAHGPHRLADALWEYWRAALERYWPAMRSVLDDDVAHRAAELTKHGLMGLLGEVHPELSVTSDTLRIEKKRYPDYHQDHDLAGAGILLVPSIFVWPHLLFAADPAGSASLTFPARGIANVWETRGSSAEEDDTLGQLIGRSRAAILRSLSIARSTTELAISLRQSPPSISQHLSVLRRSALVVSWRSGRKVLYRRTSLGTSIVQASGTTEAASSTQA
jgi:DNA-binding transcriptional ArsR family regulator